MSSDTSTADVAACIRDFIAKNLLFSPEGYRYPDDTSFLDEGIVDSLGVMELVGFVQESFGLLVDQDEVVPRISVR